MITTFSPDFLDQVILAMRDDVAEIKQRVVSLEGKVEHHNDEMIVLTGMVMRQGSEQIAWASLSNELRRPRERAEALERARKQVLSLRAGRGRARSTTHEL